MTETNDPVMADLERTIATLNSAQCETLQAALRARMGLLGILDEGDNHAAILRIIRETLAADEEPVNSPALAVVFSATEYDNGFFLDYMGDVYFADGTCHNYDFGEDMNEVLTDEYGRVGRNSVLGVNLVTDGFEDDDYGIDNLSMVPSGGSA